MKVRKKRIILGSLGVFILIQFIRCDRSVPPIQKDQNFEDLYQPQEDIKNMLVNSCYDCHSYESKYPWYAEIAPISWMLDRNIKEGRKNLNFSEFGTYTKDKKIHQMEEAAEAVNEGEMPMALYVRMHSEAKLSESDKSKLASYFITMKGEMELGEPMNVPITNETNDEEGNEHMEKIENEHNEKLENEHNEDDD